MKVSVIIPVFNNAHCVSTALDSIINQEGIIKEILVVDDGSDDNLDEVIKGYSDKVTFIRQDNHGPAAARNAGLLAATGDYIAFLDADDFWEPTFLTETTSFLQNNSECVAVNTGSRFLYYKKPSLVRPRAMAERKLPEYPFVVKDFFSFWHEHDHIFTGTCLLRHPVVKNAGLMREDLRIAEDLEYWALIATYGSWGFIPKVLWNCNSQDSSKKKGWVKKNKVRWRSTPDLDSWGQRIEKTIEKKYLPDFEKYKGSLALSFVYNMILGLEFGRALNTFRQHKTYMPSSRPKMVYNLTSKTWITWYFMSLVIYMREVLK